MKKIVYVLVAVVCTAVICFAFIRTYAMQVFIVIPGSNSMTFEVENADTVISVKEKIKDRTGILIEHQQLLFADNSLDNERTLQSYNIQKEATIHLKVISSDGTYYPIYNASHLNTFSNIVNETLTESERSAGYTANMSANAILMNDIVMNDESFVFNADTGLVKIEDSNSHIGYLGTGIKGNGSGLNSYFDTTASVKGEWYTDEIGTEGDYTGEISKFIPIGNKYNYSPYGSTSSTSGSNDSGEAAAPSGAATPTSSPEFKGVFNGNGHTVKGLFANSNTSYIGLIGYNEGTIKNVGVIDSCFLVLGITGGVCGENRGTISKCFNTSFICGSSCVGGVCGNNYVDIDNAIIDCYNTGTIFGVDDVAGICGYTQANEVKGCYNIGVIYERDQTSYRIIDGNDEVILNACYTIDDSTPYSSFTDRTIVDLLNKYGDNSATSSGNWIQGELYPILSFSSIDVVIASVALSLEDNIYIYFRVYYDGINTQTDDYGVIFWSSDEFSSYTYQNAEVNNETIIQGSTIWHYDNVVNKDVATFNKKIAAKEMSDMVWVQAYACKNGIYYYSDIVPYSVTTYAARKLGLVEGVPATTDENLKNLLRSMLEYGAQAQIYFNYNTDNLATSILPQE